MWQQYGKGLSRAELQAAHNAASKPKTKKCNGVCGKMLPLDDFGQGRGTCNMCRAAVEVKRNDRTRGQADRIGLTWVRAEDRYIRENSATQTDEQMGRHLKRTMKAVRRRRLWHLRINKHAKPTPHVDFNEFKHIKEDAIKVITVVTNKTKVTVYSNTHARMVHIRQAFIDKGLTGDDYKTWVIGVTAGA